LNTRKVFSPNQLNLQDFTDLVIDAIQDIKGQNIVKIDLRKLHDAPADYFIICEGESNTQVRSIAENIARRTKTELRTSPNHIEGLGSSLWVVVDYFDVVVHVFYKETRSFYELEELWGDGEFSEYQNI
jgi:ribosome-associated protein